MTRTHNGKSAKMTTIRQRLLEVYQGNATYSKQYIYHLRAMVSPRTLSKWKREWQNS